jgi:outer membrane protein TolC
LSARRARFALASLVAASACVRGPPRIEGVAATPPAQTAQWTPPASVAEAAARDVVRRGPIDTIKQYTLAEAIDIALRNSPLTRQSWVQARAAADVYGSSQGRWYPTIVAGVAVNRSLALSSPNRPAGERTQYGPSGSLTYTVLDFGGRTGSIDVAQQTAIAADLTHNATVQNTILLVETAAFTYLSTRAQRDAQKSSLELATAALDAANERHHVGLATIADVLQARTARSQAELQLQTLEGILQVTKGSLAVAMGLPANTAYDVPAVTLSDSVHFITESVDSLINVAVRNRPELASARAQAEAAHSQIKVARSGYLPSLAFAGTGANNASNFSGNTYSLNLGLAVPVFSGFSNHYDVAAASEQFQAAQARTELTRQQIIQQVFTAYYSLRTATDRVRTSRELLASAIQSEEVARGRYKEGVGSIVDLLVAQSALASARSQDIDSRWQWRGALAQLAHDVGVLTARGDTTFAPFTPAPDVRPKQ